MRKNQIFLYFCLCFIGGVACWSFLPQGFFFCLLLAIFCLILTLFKGFNQQQRIYLLGAIFLFLGVIRGQLSLPSAQQLQIKNYTYRWLEFSGRVAAEPDVRATNTRIVLDKVIIVAQNQLVTGKILVILNRYQIYNYNMHLKFKCLLTTPGLIESQDEWGRTFDYGRYLAVSGIYAVCSQPEDLEPLSAADSRLTKIRTEVYTTLINTKQKFKSILDQNLPLPEAGLLSAMLLGYRRDLSAEIITQFSQTGISHIVSISGLHISIVAGLLFYVFIWLGIPRQRAFWPSVALLLVYMLLLGFIASALRAFIMGSLVLYALKVGRLSKPINALVCAAVILLVINPKIFLGDIGFQLSFLAVLGIFCFYPVFNQWLNKKLPAQSSRAVEAVVAMVAITLAAQIFTLPLVVYYFGTLSLISPLANLLILPTMTIFMASGIILIVLGLIWSKLAFVFGWLVWVLVTYVLRMASWLSYLPGAYLKIKVIPFWIIGIIYLLLFILIIFVRRKNKKI